MSDINIILWWMVLGILVNWLTLCASTLYVLYKLDMLDWSRLDILFKPARYLNVRELYDDFGVTLVFIFTNFFILLWPLSVFLIYKNLDKVIDSVANEYDIE